MSHSAPCLAGRVAIVTGASRGIGRSVALRFAEEGASVALVARSAQSLAAVFDEVSRIGGHAVVIPADVTADTTGELVASRCLDEFGRIDVLVNNAGGNSFMSPLETMRPSGWRKTITLNLDATVGMIQAVLPTMVEARCGSVVNVSSVAGLRGVPGMSHYAAAKAAVISLTQSLAVEVADRGIRVNALVPGWIDTDLTDFLRADDAIEDMALARVPMGRWGRPEEIAEGALFLASDASSFMTGQCLILDGGLNAH